MLDKASRIGQCVFLMTIRVTGLDDSLTISTYRSGKDRGILMTSGTPMSRMERRNPRRDTMSTDTLAADLLLTSALRADPKLSPERARTLAERALAHWTPEAQVAAKFDAIRGIVRA